MTVEAVEIALGKTKQLKTASFTISTGLWALVGRNGSGKSTFLNAILQSNPVLKGKFSLNNKDLNDWSATELSKAISVVYTKPSVFGNMTVFDVVKLGRLPYANALGFIKKEDNVLVENAIDTLKIKNLAQKQFVVLSDGEKQLVMIARALAQDTPMMILDEPTAFLDVVNRQDIIKLLKEISLQFNKTILFSTHDIALIPELCDGLLWIQNSELKASAHKADFAKLLQNIFKDAV